MTVIEKTVNSCQCVVVEGLDNFDINKIFDCGQCFRFDRVEHSAHEKEFSGIAYGKFVSFAQDGQTLFIYGSSIDDYLSIWKRYLDIERDYDAIAEDIKYHCDNLALSRAIEYGRGIRILSQEPFECVISFIISQNNNIPRIKKIIEALCKKCGEPIEISEELQHHANPHTSLCAFPTPSAIYKLGVDGLFELKTGFRAKYIYDAVERLMSGCLSLDAVMLTETTEDAIETLCEVKGIGRKVASCALLFGFKKYDAFPIDVWMKKVALKYFGAKGEELSAKDFGAFAGIAQQYLFYYERYRSQDNV